MTAVRGTRLPSLDRDGLVAGFEDVKAPILNAVADADRVVLVPDVHYPYHHSTGMVTNPNVVETLASTFAVRQPNIDVTVALRSQDPVDTERTVEFLGYDELDDSTEVDVEILDETTGEATVAGGASVDASSNGAGSSPQDGQETDEFTVPEPLADASVIAVPSARIGGSVPMMGCLGVVATAAGADPTDSAQVRRVLETVEPDGALVDATYTFTGEPRSARALLGGADVGAVESALAELLGVQLGDVPGFSHVSPSDTSGPVTGLDVAALAAELPDGQLPASTDPHPAVQAGYRLYTLVSGDVYPPQLRGGQ